MSNHHNVILKNTFFNIGGRFGTLLVSLFLTPYLVYKLGESNFGLWSITLALTGIMGIIDLGIAPAITKFVAELRSRQNLQDMADLIFSGLSIAFLIVLAFIALVWALSYQIVRKLQVPMEMESLALSLIRGTSIILGIAFLSNCIQSGLIGLQRMDLLNGINVSSSLFGAIASFTFLESGWGLKGLIFSHAFAAILALLLGLWGMIHLVSPKFVIRARPRWSLIGTMFGYGWKIQVSTICGLVIPLMNKFLITAYAGLRHTGFFEIGSRIINYSNSLPIAFFTALTPAWAESAVIESKEKLSEKYHCYLDYFLFLSVPFILFTITCAKPIVLSWIGRGYEQSIWVVQILLIGYGVNLQTGIGTSLIRGIGRPELEMYYGLLTLGVNGFLAVILGKQYGFIGVLIGATVGQLVGSIYFFLFVHSIVGHHYWRKIVYSMGASILPSLLMVELNYFEEPISWIKMNRWSTFCTLILEGFIFFGIYILISLKHPFWKDLINYKRKIVGGSHTSILFGTAVKFIDTKMRK